MTVTQDVVVDHGPAGTVTYGQEHLGVVEFDLMSLPPGQTLEISNHLQTWWVTATVFKRSLTGGKVCGFSVASKRTAYLGPESPLHLPIDRFVCEGEMYHIGRNLRSGYRLRVRTWGLLAPVPSNE